MTRESGAEWGFTEQGWNGKAFGRQGEEWVVSTLIDMSSYSKEST